MRLKAPLIAGLFSCVALVGCTGSDDKDAAASQGTFDGAAKDLNTQVSQPSDTISQAVQVKQAQSDADIAALRVTLGEVQQTLKTLEAGVTAAKTENDLTKLRRFNLPQAEDDAAALALKLGDISSSRFSPLIEFADNLRQRIDLLQANFPLVAADRARLQNLAGDLEKARTDLVAASTKFDADRATLTSTNDAIRQLLETVKTKADAASITALTDQIVSLSIAIEAVKRSSGGAIKDLSTRLAALENALDSLQPRSESDMALAQFVNLFIGTTNTDSGGGHSGNVNPGAQTPFGMVSFGPDTKGSGGEFGEGSGGYYYDDAAIQYFSMTHLNGPGCRSQGAVAMLPQETNSPISSNDARYSHTDERARPGYYRVKFNNILSELTATTRTGMARFSYADKDKAFLVIDATLNNRAKTRDLNKLANLATITLGEDRRTISGKAFAGSFCGGTWDQPVYFHAAFDKPLKKTSSVKDGAATLQFDLTDTDKTVQVKIGISSVSADNARQNLETENNGWSFETVRQQSRYTWNKRLNTIQIGLAKAEEQAKLTSDQQQRATVNLTKFYTAFYRVYSGPTVFSDVNGEYRSMKQTLPFPAKDTLPDRITENVANYKFALDGKESGYKTHYSGFSMWDTYRSAAQLVALVTPDEASEMMQSLVADAQQCGAFPHWVNGSEDTIPMQGDHALNVIAGSYLFGARKFDLANARKYMEQSTSDPTSACNDKLSVGRNANLPALPDYLKLGYIATDAAAKWHASSATIEMTTSDRSAAAFLASLPASAGVKPDTIQALFKRASNWLNIFDTGQKKLRAKDKTGKWQDGSFHESTEENYIWAFSHDWTALIGKLGGKDAAIARLNTLFSIPALSAFGNMKQEPSGKSLNGGEASAGYYIGNEPAFQTPWAYNWAAAPKYAQYIIPVIMNKNFSINPSGLPGNDDMGATSAWYVWAALGLYPVIPSAPGLAVSTPQFSDITVRLGNDKELHINTDKNAILDNVRYIDEMKLNDTPYQGLWLPLDKIRDGGKLNFKLSATPTAWGEDDSLVPPSGPNTDYSKPTAKPPAGAQIIP